ncbi:hypothetical protein Hamer_G029376, partial [Homarus americanus]
TISTNMSEEGALTNQRLRRDISSQSGVRRVGVQIPAAKGGQRFSVHPTEICIACVLLGGTEGEYRVKQKVDLPYI